MRFDLFGKEILIRKEYAVISVLILFVLLTLFGWYLKTNRIEVFVTDESVFGSELQTDLIGGVAQIGKISKPESKGTPSDQSTKSESKELQTGQGSKSEGKEAPISVSVSPGSDNDVESIRADQSNALTNPKFNDIYNDALININTAGAEELIKLNGIGKVKSEAIIAYRENNGFFNSIDEIINVKGIGEATYSKIMNHITVEENN